MKTVLTAADWTLLQEIFNQAVELPPEPRAIYLDAACRERPDLRARVEALVRPRSTRRTSSHPRSRMPPMNTLRPVFRRRATALATIRSRAW